MSDQSPRPDANQTARKAWWALLLTLVVMQSQWLINGGTEAEIFWQWLGSRFFEIAAPSPEQTWAALKAFMIASIASVIGGGIVGKAVHAIPNRPI